MRITRGYSKSTAFDYLMRSPFTYVADDNTPYHVHFLQRITNEMPEIELSVIFTHRVSDFN